MIYPQAKIRENEMHKILCDFEMQIDHQIMAKRPDRVLVNCNQLDFVLLADHWVKIKESEKINKYLDFVRDFKKLWTMRMT